MQRYVLLRLKQATPFVRVGTRLLGHHSRFGNLHAVPLLPALRLVEAGEARLLDQFRLGILRAQVAAMQA